MSSASNLLAHLRPCKISVDFDGKTFTIPAMDAIEWVALIDGEEADLYEIFPVLAGTEAIEAVEDALWEGRATSSDVADAALAAVAAAGDRPWWVILRILRDVAPNWSVLHVNNAAGMSLAGWLDQVWSKIMDHIDPKHRTQWMSQIDQPPKGHAAEIDFDAEEQAFLAAMNAVMR